MSTHHSTQSPTATAVATTPDPPADPAATPSPRLTPRRRLAELLAGDLRALPVVAGLTVLVLIFSLQSPFFLSSRNLSNLLVQAVVTGIIALGLVFVLLLGEIDLSVAAISGVCSVLMAKLMAEAGMSSVLAVVVAVVLGAVIGAFTGSWATRFLVPTFVVTLGLGLILNGVQLQLLPRTGRYNLLGTGIEDIAGSYVTGAASWLLVVLAVVVVAGLKLTHHQRKASHGIDSSVVKNVVLPVAVTAVAGVLVVSVLDANAGIPTPVVIFGVLLAITSYILTETRFGLSLYAVGGNAEAALRSGIKVNRVKIAAFALAGGLAALAGIIAASRLLGVSVSSGGGIGGGALLLNAIAAAVIGGVSLFGGRGRASSALLGALIIATVGNGLNLLGVSTDVQLLVTGALLVLAVTVDRSVERLSGSVGR
ncbi:D-xylose transport system permease protein [Klenkia soli]|uniref:Xylose transport system permease protein XylH n=1 Tax=Klenkia soli TaxID=1052260 RepID=A0A1H0G1Q6_9ACTN|nr:ABC transporter permease [Klenkia soli]SDO00790.1 D-xylose transport system permease protein [Klenkia soli]